MTTELAEVMTNSISANTQAPGIEVRGEYRVEQCSRTHI